MFLPLLPGAVEVVLTGIYPIEPVRAADTELERRHTHGKIVLLPWVIV